MKLSKERKMSPRGTRSERKSIGVAGKNWIGLEVRQEIQFGCNMIVTKGGQQGTRPKVKGCG